MASFGDILKQGRKRFETKNSLGGWGKCESCDERKYLFPYRDEKNEKWTLCDGCSDMFIKEEE